MAEDFAAVTERAGEPATDAQVHDMLHRYLWAAELCRGKRVLEVACGTGQGLGILRQTAALVEACDIDAGAVAIARSTWPDLRVQVAGADQLPCPDGSVDAVLLFEALYYLPDVPGFLRECRRVLAPQGRVLLTTNNKDVFDFVPSMLSRRYYGAAELPALLRSAGFSVELFGQGEARTLSLRHRVLRPAKVLAGRLGLLPKTMHGKARLRRLLFGKLEPMPKDLSALRPVHVALKPLPTGGQADGFRFIYAMARRDD